MVNKIYEDGFYNEEQKLRYINLKELNSEANATAVKRILSRARSIEEDFQRDLYDFNIDQINLIFNYLNPSTFRASRNNFYHIRDYINWAVQEGLRKDNVNPLLVMSKNEYYMSFVDKNKKVLYTKDEIDEIVNGCVNSQDGVVVQLLFEGAFGTKDYVELLNLKRSNLLPNNRLLLEDTDRVREIPITEKCAVLVKDALEKEVYIKRNGNVKATNRNGSESKLIMNEYVLRNVLTQSKNDERADKYLVARRLAAIRSYFPDWVRALNALIVRKSGMVWMAKRLLDERGKLEKDEYIEICLQFGIREVDNNGHVYLNYTMLRDDFLNIDTINELYGDK